MNRKDKNVLKEDHKRWFRQNYSINENNMKYIKIPRDGNCAIHCIFLALLIENKINSATFLQLSPRERKKKIREYIIYLRCHVADISSKEKDEQLKENMLKKLLDVRSEKESANWFSDMEIISIASMYGINIFPSQNKQLNYMYIGPNFDREKPLFLYDYVDNNHFEFYIRLEKFNNLDSKLRTFLENYHLNKFEITNVEVLQYCSNIDENIKIDDKKIDIPNEIKKKMKNTLRQLTPHTLNRFNKDDEVIYIKKGKNEKVKIIDVHFDDAPDIYYTINDGKSTRVIQTPEQFLRKDTAEIEKEKQKSKATSKESKATSNESKATSNESKATSKESKATSNESKATSNESKATSKESKATSKSKIPYENLNKKEKKMIDDFLNEFDTKDKARQKVYNNPEKILSKLKTLEKKKK